MRVGLWLVALAGCDSMFDLDHIPDRSGPTVDARLDAPLDAPVDAPFDPATQCPATYPLNLFGNSRYRILAAGYTAWGAHDDCTDDFAGATHLAVTQTRGEVVALRAAMINHGDTDWWLGGVQSATAAQTYTDWMWVTDEPFDGTLWQAPVEPNDGNGIEDDHQDQFVDLYDTDIGLADFDGIVQIPAVCECDGRGVTQAAANAVAQNRH